jgi:hypothetical protein
MPIYMRGILDHALEAVRTADPPTPDLPQHPLLTGGGPSFEGSGPVHALIGLLHGSPTDTIDLLGGSTHHDPLTG